MLYNAPSPDLLQAMIEEGTAAEALVSSDIFNRVVNDLVQLHTSRMLCAPVGAAGIEERERNHALHVALTEIVQELRSRALSGQQALETLQEVNDERDD